MTTEAARARATIGELRHDAVVMAAGWINEATGQGDPDRDKAAAVSWSGGMPIPWQILESLFGWNDLAAAIVTAEPEWGLRHGWDLTLEAPQEESATAALDIQRVESGVRAVLDDIGAHAAQLTAATWGRLFGGGLLLLGAVDGRETRDPLDLDALERIDWVRAVPRSDVIIESFYSHPASRYYGRPARYTVRELGPMGVEPMTFHHSRVIRYPGALTPPRLRWLNQGWDLSLLDRVVAKLSLHDGIWSNVGQMVQDGSQGVWRIQGLMNAVVNGQKDAIEERFRLADQTRSNFRSLLLDAENESFEYVTRQFAGIDGLLAQSAVRTAAAAQMPVTVLFGQSPAGLNATGESDIRLWYDRVESYQEDALRPGLEQLIRMVFRSKSGPTGGEEPERWKATFRPVRGGAPMEAGELRARQAQVDSAYITGGVVAPEEVAVSRFTSEGWSAETQIDLARRARKLRAQTEDAAGGAGGAGADEEQALNSAQMQAAAGVVAQVARREIPRESAVELLLLAFPQQLDRTRAEKLIGSAGAGFSPATPEGT